METTTRMVAMSDEELARFEAYKRQQQEAEEKQRTVNQREEYRILVDSLVDESIPTLLSISDTIREAKQSIQDNFRTAIEMKRELFGLKRDDQRSHSFSNTECTKRIILGNYIVAGYLDTVEEGIEIVMEYLESLAHDEASKNLVKMVLKLLAKDAKGTLNSDRIRTLTEIASKSGNARFMEGVEIINAAYRPTLSKQYIKAQVKNEYGAWVNVPLGMTESGERG